MTNRRVTRLSVEVLSTDPAPDRRVTRIGVEALQTWQAPIPQLIARWDASTLGLADGATVLNLPDLSGNGFHLSTTASVKPVYETNSLNGMGGVKFSGNQSIWGNVTLTNPKTFIYVIRTPPNDGYFRHICYGSGGLGTFRMSREVSGLLSWGTYDPHLFVNDFALMDAPHLFTYVQKSGGAGHVRIDKVKRAGWGTDFASDAGLNVNFGQWNDPAPGPKFTLYEMQIYNGQMNLEQYSAVEDALWAKWLAVPPPVVPADWLPEMMMWTIEGLARHNSALAETLWDEVMALVVAGEVPHRLKGEYGPDGTALTPDNLTLGNALAIRAGKAIGGKNVQPLVPFLEGTQITMDDPAITEGGWTLTGDPEDPLESRATAAIIGQLGTSLNV